MASPTRVVFFIPTMAGGGAERVLVNLLQHLDRSVFSPHLILMRREGPHIDAIPRDVPLTVLGASSLWTAAARLAAALRRLAPDVVVAATGGAGVPAVIAHRLLRSRARLIIWERSALVGGERGAKHGLLLSLKKVLWPRADLVTAVGARVAADVRRHTGIPPEKTLVLYSPILDPAITEKAKRPIEHPWFSDSVPIVLAVTRFEPVKDPLTLVRAFARLVQERPARLILLGEGSMRDALLEEVHRAGLSDRVWFAGFVDNPFQFMARSQVLALTSLQEGLPGVVVQAMACGLPVVATDSPGGTGELVRHEETGLLVPVGDDEELAVALQRVLDEPEFAKTLADRARGGVRCFEVDVAMKAFERSLLRND